ncbi:hypothetical protein STEG23_015149 [Scotinomys teguina]
MHNNMAPSCSRTTDPDMIPSGNIGYSHLHSLLWHHSPQISTSPQVAAQTLDIHMAFSGITATKDITMAHSASGPWRLSLAFKFNCECGTRCIINKCHHLEMYPHMKIYLSPISGIVTYKKGKRKKPLKRKRDTDNCYLSDIEKIVYTILQTKMIAFLLSRSSKSIDVIGSCVNCL